jgi:hypothetical protein
MLERPFAHLYETGRMRRLHVRGKGNVQKKLLLQAAACNLALILRRMLGAGTPRALENRRADLFFVLLWITAGKIPPKQPHGTLCVSKVSPRLPFCPRRLSARVGKLLV